MNRAVLYSASSTQCEHIAIGKQLMLLSKKRPKLETPFAGYIYCTQNKPFLYREANPPYDLFLDRNLVRGGDYENRYLSGKVIGEFVCDRIYNIDINADFIGYDNINSSANTTKTFLKMACLTIQEVHSYLGYFAGGYAWRISNCKIYNTPKALSEFFVYGECQNINCIHCKNFHEGQGWLDGSTCDEDSCIVRGVKPLTWPPRSFCYVEEI